jgi:hypothetical protein
MDITKKEDSKRPALTTIDSADPVVRLPPVPETDAFAKNLEHSRNSLGEVALVPSPASSIETGGYFADLKGHRAVVDSITVHDRRLDTLLSEGTFDRNRTLQEKYAKLTGYRIARRSENLSYVKSLLAKEEARTINEAEKGALEIYRSRHVRDDLGGLDVSGREVVINLNCWFSRNLPRCCALLVRSSEIPVL